MESRGVILGTCGPKWDQVWILWPYRGLRGHPPGTRPLDIKYIANGGIWGQRFHRNHGFHRIIGCIGIESIGT